MESFDSAPADVLPPSLIFNLFSPGHFTLSVFPMMIFGPLSLVVFLVAALSDLFRRLVGRPTEQERRNACANRLGAGA